MGPRPKFDRDPIGPLLFLKRSRDEQKNSDISLKHEIQGRVESQVTLPANA